MFYCYTTANCPAPDLGRANRGLLVWTRVLGVDLKMTRTM
jgi:hypothetical protein